MLKGKLIELIERVGAEEQAVFANLDEAERSAQGQPDQWAPKDVIAHLAAWKEREVANLAAEARGEPPVRYSDFEEVNARDFEAYRHKTAAEILEKAVEANRQLIEQITARSEAELEEVTPRERKSWQSIAGIGCAHPMIHLGQLCAEHGDSEHGTRLQEQAAADLLALGGDSGWQGTVRYNLACHYALIGEAEKAIGKLREALELNPGLREWSREDPDFASVREEPDYLALYES